jgi:cytochrome P450
MTQSRPDMEVIFDPRTYAQGVPYEIFDRLRHQSPVVWVEEKSVLNWPTGPGYWAVLRYADVKQVLRDHARFSSHLGGTQIRDPRTPQDLAFVQQMMLNMDPPDHSRLRRLLAKAFTPRATAALEATIHARARRIVADVADRGEGDFVRDIGAELPLLTLAEVMGVPESDRALLHDWANRVIGYQDEDYAASDTLDITSATPMALRARAVRPQPDAQGRMPDPRTRAGLIDLYTYAHELANYKRRHPGDDVMSILLQAEDEGGKITTAEFENMFFLFAVAGNETTRNGIPGGMYCLLEHPDEYRRLLSDRTLLSSAVEEMLRYWPPVLHFRRTATRDSELNGQLIRAGQKVVVYHVSANRDPDVFPDPHRFDVGRSPNEHLSFGSGVHACLGAPLARMQMRAIFSEIFDQLGELEPAGPPARLVSNFQLGLKRLPVRWKKAARPGVG